MSVRTQTVTIIGMRISNEEFEKILRELYEETDYDETPKILKECGLAASWGMDGFTHIGELLDETDKFDCSDLVDFATPCQVIAESQLTAHHGIRRLEDNFAVFVNGTSAAILDDIKLFVFTQYS